MVSIERDLLEAAVGRGWAGARKLIWERKYVWVGLDVQHGDIAIGRWVNPPKDLELTDEPRPDGNLVSQPVDPRSLPQKLTIEVVELNDERLDPPRRMEFQREEIKTISVTYLPD